jgi:hypothetical protein
MDSERCSAEKEAKAQRLREEIRRAEEAQRQREAQEAIMLVAMMASIL